MRRQEFIDNITTWGELLDFCYDEDCTVCSDVVSDDERYNAIEDRLVDWARNNTWRELYDILSTLDDKNGYDWYSYDEYYGTWEPLDDDYDFDNRKDSVLEWMDDGGYWDDSDEEEDEEEEPEEGVEEDPVDPEDQIPTPDEDCSFHDLFASGVGCLEIITAEEREQELGIEQDFAVMTAAFKTI